MDMHTILACYGIESLAILAIDNPQLRPFLQYDWCPTHKDKMIRDEIKCQTVHRTVLNDNKHLIYPMALNPEIIESRIQCIRKA